MAAVGKFDIRSPFVERKADGKDIHLFEREARKTVGEKIKGLFAVVCAQTKSMTPGDDNKQDLGSLWMQAASVISQMMNTDHVERNTEVQQASYHLGLAGLVGHSHEAQSDVIKFDGEHAVSIRTNLAPINSQGRMFQVVAEKGGALIRNIVMDPNDTEVVWDGRNNEGQEVDAGAYRIRVVNIDENGKEMSLPTFVDREIEAVGYDDKGIPYFIEGKERVYEVNKWTKPISTMVRKI